MEDEIDCHHLDSTSPLTETAVVVVPIVDNVLSSVASSSTDMTSSKSSSREDINCVPGSSAMMTSSKAVNPIAAAQRPSNLPSRLRGESGSPTTRGTGSSPNTGESRGSFSVGTFVSIAVDDTNDENLRAPIIGYEVMEQRAKFTVFKIHIRKSDRENWLVFRRYTDFVRVNDKLKEIFPMFRLSLPPKRWFGSNFDPNFLEDRQLGLQAFIDNIIGHKDIVISGPAREFLCLDDPPGPYDSLEESRALCESLDETVYNLCKELAERDTKLATVSAELVAAQKSIELLNHQIKCRSTKVTKAGNSHCTSTPVSGENPTTEGDIRSQAEADQSFTFAQSEIHSMSPVPKTDDDGDDESLSSRSNGTNRPKLLVTAPTALVYGQGSSSVDQDKHGHVDSSSQSNIITIT